MTIFKSGKIAAVSIFLLVSNILRCVQLRFWSARLDTPTFYIIGYHLNLSAGPTSDPGHEGKGENNIPGFPESICRWYKTIIFITSIFLRKLFCNWQEHLPSAPRLNVNRTERLTNITFSRHNNTDNPEKMRQGVKGRTSKYLFKLKSFMITYLFTCIS